MPPKTDVRIGRRFLRSIRIDNDLGDPQALDGFICPRTSAEVLMQMAKHVSNNRHSAFIWTGPYGSGKSSLIIGLDALLSGNTPSHRRASKIFDKKLIKAVKDAFPKQPKAWKSIPIVGRREHPAQLIGEALKGAGLVSRNPRGGWTDTRLIENILEILKSHKVAIFVDEMGKFLEGAINDGFDIYIFQQLAELAARSDGRLLFVGVLHQAFEEYGHRLSREMRDEWAKIQGRFIELPVATSGEEHVDLLSHAIENGRTVSKPGKLAQLIASLGLGGSTDRRDSFAKKLDGCWPLHPLVACLLGPISRRRFGQNQRSIFGFLNSAEPHGFQDFLSCWDNSELYRPHDLWDYLRANLEPSIIASPDGHRWVLATAAMERCEALGGEQLHLNLLKTIAVADLFKERSGLAPSSKLLEACFVPAVSPKDLKKCLRQLAEWSLIVFRKFRDAYAIYAGSDFDLDGEVRKSMEDVKEIDFQALKQIAGLQPILAKRHYHETGTMRWFDVNICHVRNIIATSEEYKPQNGAIGQFLLGIQDVGEQKKKATTLCTKASKCAKEWDIIAGTSKHSQVIIPLAIELLALDSVQNNYPELAGDDVARREVAGRTADLTAQLEFELRKAFDKASWYQQGRSVEIHRQADLNSMASKWADERFKGAPIIHNELLNRQKPSSSAVSARNILLRKMILNEGDERLGIEEFPAEGGLFESILDATKLYGKTAKVWKFSVPRSGKTDARQLAPLWEESIKFIRSNKKRLVSASELYQIWRQPPFGVKDGLMPILMVAFIFSQQSKIAIYREHVFREHFDDVDIDFLTQDDESIQLRWMSLSRTTKQLLSEMAGVVRDLEPQVKSINMEPLQIARRLVGIYERLPQWTKRTARLSENALRIRDLFRRARDPNQFLFDDLPKIAKAEGLFASEAIPRIAKEVRKGLGELVRLYPSALNDLRNMMLKELKVPNSATKTSWKELRARAENIRQTTGDFRLEAFIGRLSQFDDSPKSIEGIVSLVTNKPPRDWVDRDLDQASIEIASLAQEFLRTEIFARVKGRDDKRQSIAMVIGMQGESPSPLLEEFQVSDIERSEVEGITKRIMAALQEANTSKRNLILAALAEISAQYMAETPKRKSKGKR